MTESRRVGPHGYIHGWIFVGAPGTTGHAKSVHDFAEHINQVHGPATAEAVHRAAGHLEAGNNGAADLALEEAENGVRNDIRKYATSAKSRNVMEQNLADIRRLREQAARPAARSWADAWPQG
jgi:hypothetical protein